MQKENMVFSNGIIANEGDVILFKRKEKTYKGKVFFVRNNSVLVEISNEAAESLGYEQPNTVVGHGNYIVSSINPHEKS